MINWGRNSYGQLGCELDERVSSWNPAVLQVDEKLSQFAVGSEHNVVLTGRSFYSSKAFSPSCYCVV